MHKFCWMIFTVLLVDENGQISFFLVFEGWTRSLESELHWLAHPSTARNRCLACWNSSFVGILACKMPVQKLKTCCFLKSYHFIKIILYLFLKELFVQIDQVPKLRKWPSAFSASPACFRCVSRRGWSSKEAETEQDSLITHVAIGINSNF